MNHGVHGEQKHRTCKRIHAVYKRNQQHEAELAADAGRNAHKYADENADEHQTHQIGRCEHSDQR